LHEAVEQDTDELACSHAPLPSQLPSLPQVVVTAHWPVGAAVPALMFAHVPLALPVRLSEQAMQVEVHALLQQKPSTQELLRHWVLLVHV
jgi:hypothetical protein